jgi:NAD(P)-dependent dehydrogenase (short-subunit alcohol dehydrogenase family)
MSHDELDFTKERQNRRIRYNSRKEQCSAIMSQRIKDTKLASDFTATQHSKAAAKLDPENNKLRQPLNVLIVGASQGIGAGIAEAYAKAGVANLILAARGSSIDKVLAVEQKAKEIAPSINTKCLDVDITSSPSVAKLVKAVKEVFDVNVIGTYAVAHHFIPLLKESDGAKTFIAVNSFAALITSGNIANTAYCISKFAQARFIEFISEQYSADGVLAVAVHPGAVNTEMADKTTPESFRPCKLFLDTCNQANED